MDDISGDVNDKFGCGTSIGCKDMIANGPSLVFTKDGLMYVAGEGRLHVSKDGGHSWLSAATKKTASELLGSAVMILSQKGSVWSSNGQSWTQLRGYRPDVHEVRLHLKEGRIDIEDDTGFKANMTWKDQLSRQPTTAAGTVATPTNSKAGGTLLPAAGTNVAPKLPGISNGTGDDPFPKTPVINPLR
ncbi:MAG TPA: hypothetical protein DCE42_13735 [Myxococcales bacterium]|nr:hypothetical protein [Myxococcales bacterium]|tara:strand:- start:889 stop:1452 length:564 start_codon:yes stop_codon:yes gene_type:complete